jgi:hypothetical protein
VPRLLACLALALLTGLTAGTEAGARAQGCATAGKTVLSNGTVRVYEKTKRVVGPDQGEETAARDEQRLWACRLATGRRLRLDAPCTSHDVGFGNLASCDETWAVLNTNGRYIGIGFDRNGSGFSNRNQVVWARMGRNPRRRVAYRLQKPTDLSEPRVVELYVSPRGGLAFSMRGIRVPDGRNHSAIATVAPLEPGKRPHFRLLDSGVGVVAKSLKAAGRRLTWKSGSRTEHGRWR